MKLALRALLVVVPLFLTTGCGAGGGLMQSIFGKIGSALGGLGGKKSASLQTGNRRTSTPSRSATPPPAATNTSTTNSTVVQAQPGTSGRWGADGDTGMGTFVTGGGIDTSLGSL